MMRRGSYQANPFWSERARQEMLRQWDCQEQATTSFHQSHCTTRLEESLKRNRRNLFARPRWHVARDRSCQGVHVEERAPVSWAEQQEAKQMQSGKSGKVRLRAYLTRAGVFSGFRQALEMNEIDRRSQFLEVDRTRRRCSALGRDVGECCATVAHEQPETEIYSN